MNTQNNGCNPGRIDAFLNSDHVAIDDLQLVDHLDTCDVCRNYIETQAAEADRWAKATELLKPAEFDQAGTVECSAATSGHQRIEQPLAAINVLDALAPSDDPNRLGRLGGYEVSGVVGVGGMGVVLKAVDPALDRVVAIKVMAPHLANNGTARKRFSREAKAAAAVLHPNVIPIHSVSSDETIPYLVMAYIRGGSLQKRLQREGPLTTVEILRIGSQVAAGLAVAHEQGLVHRDIKPENILLEDGVERVTLTDFGLARAVDDASVTGEGAIAGTPQYMSPEQARGESVDQASDLFSLGSVLYALCTGRPPFRADTSYGVMRRIIDEKATAIREINPEIPEWLAQIVDKLMAKDKTDRYASAHEVHTLLESCLSHVQQPTHTELPASLLKSMATPPTRRGPQEFLASRTGVSILVSLLTVIFLAFTVPSLIDKQKNTDPSPTNGAPEEVAGDLELLQGAWIVESATEGGEQVLATDQGSHLPSLQIEGNTFSKIESGSTGRWHKYQMEIDSTKSPKTIDLIISRELDLRVVGIFEVKDGNLRVCFNDFNRFDAKFGVPDNIERAPLKRPANFTAPAGSKNVLLECRLAGGKLDELLLRDDKGLLSKAEENQLIDLILERQGDRRLPWNTEMGDVIEKRWVAGKLDRDIWEKYTAKFVSDYFDVQVRPRIVIGTTGGVKLKLVVQDVRCGSGKHITFQIQEKSFAVRIGDNLLMSHNMTGNLGTLRHKGGSSSLGRSLSFGQETWEAIKPGRQTITYESELSILKSAAPEQAENPEVFASRKVIFEAETTFLPAGQTTVNINTDPLMKADVDRSIEIHRITTGLAVNPKTDNKYYSNIRLNIQSLPIDIAFDIILKDGKNEYPSGSVTSAAVDKTSWEGMAYLPVDLSGKHVDVILRPAPDKAELTVDLFEIWGEEIVFRNVLVKMPGVSTSPVVIRPDRQVTHITKPLDGSGHVDYLAAINQRYSQDVTPATNWTVALLKEFGPPKLRHDSLTDFWAPLGIQPISPEGPFLKGYQFGSGYSELDQKASESFLNSRGPWTANRFPHEARWLATRKLALDRLVEASKLPHNYVPQVTSAEEHARRIQEIQNFFEQQLQSSDRGEKLGATVGAMLTSNMRLSVAPLSRLQGTDSSQHGRALARMLSRRALLRIGEADIQAAQSNLQAIHRIGWLSGQGNLLQWIMGMAIDEMASVGDLDMLESGKLTKEQCEQYLHSLKQLPSPRSAMGLLNIELRYQALDAVQFAALHHDETIRQLFRLADIDKLALSRIQKLDWSEVMRRVNRLFDEQHDLYNSPERSQELIAYENSEPQLDSEKYATILIERAKEGPEELTEFMAQMYFDQISSRQLRRVESRPKTRRRVVQAGLAAELYRFEHGAYPESLEPLKSLVSEPLVDAFTGKPFQFKSGENSVLIYSPGLNGTDEGGVDLARLDGWSGTGPTPDDIAVSLKRTPSVTE